MENNSSRAGSDDPLDETSAQNLHSFSHSMYPDPDTVVGDPWWTKAHISPSPVLAGDGMWPRSQSRSQLETFPDLTQYWVTAPDPSGSQVGARFADPYRSTRDNDVSESDYALPEEDEMYASFRLPALLSIFSTNVAVVTNPCQSFHSLPLERIRRNLNQLP